MTTLSTTVRNRRIEIEVPDDWPDGTTVDFAPRLPSPHDGPMTSEEIARIAALMEAMEPVEFTDEERAAWDADRAERKRRELANFDAHAEELRRMWE